MGAQSQRAGSVVIGAFVGGRSSRMYGQPKGLLPAPDTGEALVERLLRVAREACATADVVLVGQSDAYAHLGLTALHDAPQGVGPLGGLIALLDYGVRVSASAVVALAADLPYVSSALVARLIEESSSADVVAPRIDGVWQPLFARYAPERTLVAAHATLQSGRYSLQNVIGALNAVELSVTSDEVRLLTDWDTPDDIKG